jgi:hypothetical protein
MRIIRLTAINRDPVSVAKRIRSPVNDLLHHLIRLADSAIKPIAAYQTSYVDELMHNGVIIDREAFSSRVLRRNLDGIGRVFPFVLTIGQAFDDLLASTENLLEKYLLDEIGNLALSDARGQLEQHIRSTFALETISCMAPGSLEDWPTEQQKFLFKLLSGVESKIGVRLTESFLMVPKKSISGIYFPSEVTFFSCQLCPRKRCKNRKARFDEAKMREYGMSE